MCHCYLFQVTASTRMETIRLGFDRMGDRSLETNSSYGSNIHTLQFPEMTQKGHDMD